MIRIHKRLRYCALIALASCVSFSTLVFCQEAQPAGGKQFDLTCEVELWMSSSDNLSGVDEGHTRRIFSIDLKTKRYMCRAECDRGGSNGPFRLENVSNQRIVFYKFDDSNKPAGQKGSEEINRPSGEYKLEKFERSTSGWTDFLFSGQCKTSPFTPFSQTQF
jgi:hypothetical protein